MARPFGRQNPPEDAIPEEWQRQLQDQIPDGWRGSFQEGELGPWKKADRAEFYHLNRATQEYLLRLSPTEVRNIMLAVELCTWVRMVGRWAKRAFFFFTGGLGIAVAAGENLQKLGPMISGIVSTLQGLF